MSGEGGGARLKPGTVIAIDGPAASGKSTVARRVAEALGFDYVSTGEMYRAVAWLLLQEGRPGEKKGGQCQQSAAAARIVDLLDSNPPEARFENGICTLRLGKLDPMPFLHDWEVAATVSEVARIPEVRQRLVAFQRAIAAGRQVVMEGRDIGTVVFPETAFKFFIDAAPEIREARRRAQGRADAIAERDRMDSSRTVAPLAAAADAVRIDTSHLTAEEVTARILAMLADRGLGPAGGKAGKTCTE